MRNSRSSSATQALAGGSHGGQRGHARQGYPTHRSQSSLDSPPRLKHQRGGPSMSAERFLLIVAEVEARANELWEREQIELQRGAELMVIRCGPAPPSPHHAMPLPPQQQQAPAEHQVSSPLYPFEHSSLLHPHPHGLQSPSLLPVVHQFNSPGGWSHDFDSAIAVSLGFGPPATDTSEEPACVGPGGMHVGPSTSNCGQQPHGHQQQLPAWPPLGVLHDVEALITIPHGQAFGGGGGGSATARTAKARLLDRFDCGGGGGGGAAAVQHSQSTSPFYGLYSCTPGADDFLGSPQSWTRGYL